MNWKVYNELAWVDELLAKPEDCAEEVEVYVREINRRLACDTDIPTMLHLGCGAGGHDYNFKKHFQVTGVDISLGMLAIARKRNPEIEYITDDMRTVKLDKKFDIVIIPDSIMYMTAVDDLTAVVKNAVAHLKATGVLLIVAHTREDFRNNNFAYTDFNDSVHVTVLENNYIISDDQYEATMVYLIRANGDLSIKHEVHTLGLFSYVQWQQIFNDSRLNVDELDMNELYNSFLLEDGEYKLKLFICKLLP